jgi:hypothetical protein
MWPKWLLGMRTTKGTRSNLLLEFCDKPYERNDLRVRAVVEIRRARGNDCGFFAFLAFPDSLKRFAHQVRRRLVGGHAIQKAQQRFRGVKATLKTASDRCFEELFHRGRVSDAIGAFEKEVNSPTVLVVESGTHWALPVLCLRARHHRRAGSAFSPEHLLDLLDPHLAMCNDQMQQHSELL